MGFRKFSPGPRSHAQNWSRSLVCDRAGVVENARWRHDLQWVWTEGLGNAIDAAEGGSRGGIVVAHRAQN